MTGETGLLLLCLAAVAALAGLAASLVAEHPAAGSGWDGTGRRAAHAQAVFCSASFLILVFLFIVSDFSVSSVVSYSHTDKPLLYRITGTWGNHEGSLLLWVTILSLYSAALARKAATDRDNALLYRRALGVQSFLSTGFFAFILFTSSPFTRVWPPPANGQGLNPLLQDIGLALHPPMLYLGYVGFSVPFSLAIAALICGRASTSWARIARPWSLVAWCFLGGGIALGSFWAYYELGWGGYWFWDPVENAALMPWIAGTALIHSLIVTLRRDALRHWTLLLAILTFCLSLLGAFLVRSGVVQSVHSFASDPERGVFILAFLGIVLFGSLFIHGLRAPHLTSTGRFHSVSREGMLVVNNILLTIACLIVMLGTLYPMFLDAMGGESITVGPPFFNTSLLPVLLFLVAGIAIGTRLPWKRLPSSHRLLRRLWPSIPVTVLLVTPVAVLHPFQGILPLVLFCTSAFLLVSSLLELAGRAGLGRLPLAEAARRLLSMPASGLSLVAGHAGLALILFGIAAETGWGLERALLMKTGDTTSLAGYHLRLDSVAVVPGENYRALSAVFSVRDDTDRTGPPLFRLAPSSRFYGTPPVSTTEAAIRTGLTHDLYVVIGKSTDDNSNIPPPIDAGTEFGVRIYYNPFVLWIWIGVLVMIAGGILPLLAARRRAAAVPARQHREAPG